jgi:NAD(P)-dependent dehydrogenase (short-subunit alcohol dehydrogenase family)
METITPVAAVPSTVPHQTKVAIITGASSGIGRATSIALCAAGWKTVLSARREAELNETARLCEVAAQQAETHPVAETPNRQGDTGNSTLEKSQDIMTLVVVGDVTGEEDVRRLFDRTVAVYGEHLILKQ